MIATEQAEFICFLDTVPRVWLFQTGNTLEWHTPEVAAQRGVKPLVVSSERVAELRQQIPALWYCHPSYYGELSPTPPQPKTQPEPEPMPAQEPKTEPKQETKSLRERLASAAKSNGNDAGKGAIDRATVGSLRPWITAVYILLLLGVVAVCAWNIMPYEVFVRGILSRFELSQFGQFFADNPAAIWIAAAVIGGAAWKLSGEWLAGLIFAFLVVALAFSNLYSWIIGAVVWAVIQAIELLPIIMSSNQGYLRAIIKEQETHQALRINKDDDGLIRAIKKGYNALPLRFLIIARRLRIWVYLLDLCICLAVYPPVREGGIERFFFILTTFQFGQLDWGNIILLFATLLAVEAVFKVLIVARNFLTYLKTSEPKGAAA